MNPPLLENTSPKLAELEARLALERVRPERPRKFAMRPYAGGGSLMLNLPVSLEELEGYFWGCAMKNQLSACWEWFGALLNNGYGQFHICGHTFLTHRIAAQLVLGRVPDLCVLHKCDNRKCVNPNHLFLGTRGDNFFDAVVKGRIDLPWRVRKLTPEDRQFIANSQLPTSAVVELFNISGTHVRRVRKATNGTKL